jgi:hypothetical protein
MNRIGLTPHIQGYHTEAGSEVETPYFVLTNLEVTDVFKYNQQYPVTHQRVRPTPYKITPFSETNDQLLIQELTDVCCELIQLVQMDKGVYDNNLVAFNELLLRNRNNLMSWHKLFIPSSYEYLRGAFSEANIHSARNWRPATAFRLNPPSLSNTISRVDFEGIYQAPYPDSNDGAWDTNLLKECFEAGKLRNTADDLSSHVFDLVGEDRSNEGMVRTDLELARIMIALGMSTLGRELNPGEKIIDPSAGVGDLLVAASEMIHNLTANQIVAVEVEKQFEEMLILRLGLLFASSISPTNRPQIVIEDISQSDTSIFQNVQLIVMNPPFISGIRCGDIKTIFANKIFELDGIASQLNIGQTGLEFVFLELVVKYASEGTVFSVILPKRSVLSARSRDSKTIRSFLINNFGLTNITTYPRTVWSQTNSVHLI